MSTRNPFKTSNYSLPLRNCVIYEFILSLIFLRMNEWSKIQIILADKGIIIDIFIAFLPLPCQKASYPYLRISIER